VLLIQVLALVLIANAAPILARRVLGDAGNYRLDGGIIFHDGEPILGSSKTARGLIASLLTSSVAAPLLGLDWRIGLLVGAMAMAGDLISSFVKRRMGLPPSGQSIGLDQIPEALLPLAACSLVLPIGAGDIFVGVLVFLVTALVLSRIAFTLKIRRHPY
jgi:CDP-2,3-bis-(O-geranylgeranyl)-sn-glycerol synthase